eukprot:109096-Prymnesium_polylepis.1
MLSPRPVSAPNPLRAVTCAYERDWSAARAAWAATARAAAALHPTSPWTPNGAAFKQPPPLTTEPRLGRRSCLSSSASWRRMPPLPSSS